MEQKLSLSENINEIKKELSSDEQMLASAFKIEKLYKKHKIKLFTVIGLAIAYFGGNAIIESIAQSKRESANIALLALQKDAKNSNALQELKANNPELFELFSYQQAIENNDTKTLQKLSSSKNNILADASSYHLAVLEGKPTESTLYSDLGKVYNASLLIKEKKPIEAKEELELISEESPLYNIAKMIKHYTIKGQ